MAITDTLWKIQKEDQAYWTEKFYKYQKEAQYMWKQNNYCWNTTPTVTDWDILDDGTGTISYTQIPKPTGTTLTRNIVNSWTVSNTLYSTNPATADDDIFEEALWSEHLQGHKKVVGKHYVGEIHLVDGTIIKCDKGNAEIIYSDGKRVYRPCAIRDFNRFLNASDMLELFLKEVAPLARSKHEFLNLPVELFIKWLVIKAAEQDGEAAPPGVTLPVPLLPAPTRHIHRCRSCQRFIPRKRYDAGVFFCKPEHMTRYLEKVA